MPRCRSRSLIAALVSLAVPGAAFAQGRVTGQIVGTVKDPSGAVTANGLYNYLKPNVQDEASRQNREQTPKLVGEQDRTIIKF